MLDIDVKNGQNLALSSQFLPPIAIVRQAASGYTEDGNGYFGIMMKGFATPDVRNFRISSPDRRPATGEA